MEFNLSLSAVATDHRAVPMDKNKVYDVIIAGGGPAAMTAAVYCMRKGVAAGFVTVDIGGQVGETSGIENYLGFNYIEGSQLVEKFAGQMKQFEIGLSEGYAVTEIKDGREKEVVLENGDRYRAKSIILATGNRWRKLNVPGETELTGRGVAYCAICDAPLFAGKKVAVVGGGNTGIESAIDLAKIAEKVTVIQIMDRLTADKVLIDAMQQFSNMEVLLLHEVKEIQGDKTVHAVVVKDTVSGGEKSLDVQGIFISIGLMPNTDMVKGVVELNGFGEIVVDCSCKTSAPGIFAAGDVTSVPYKQIIIAAGEGAKAALSACDYILKEK